MRNVPLLMREYSKVLLVDTGIQYERVRTLVSNSSRVRFMTPEQFGARREKYDAVFLICVLHIIPDPRTRATVLDLIADKLRLGGVLVTDVPCSRSYYRNAAEKIPMNDGWAMGVGSTRTFYKEYSAAEFDTLLLASGCFSLFKKTWIDKHIVRIWRRQKASPGTSRMLVAAG
jgi:hypothetical protein